MHDTYVFDETSRFSPDAREVVNHARCYNRVSGQLCSGWLHSAELHHWRWQFSLDNCGPGKMGAKPARTRVQTRLVNFYGSR